MFVPLFQQIQLFSLMFGFYLWMFYVFDQAFELCVLGVDLGALECPGQES